MTTKTCDRCGAEIREYPWQAMKFPTYSIVKVNADVCGVVPIDSVDLCKECMDEFAEWLKKKPKEEDNENRA